MPKVSVIVPVYGVEKYIERCARSLFEQTLDDIEYLFIDDCTPDRSIEILRKVLEEYPQRKPQVMIHRMAQNSGQAAVRKWGMQNATGEYVIHCDSDDWVDKDTYRALYDKARAEKSEIAICDLAVSNEESNRIVAGCSNIDKALFLRDVCSMCTSWSLCNKIICRELYQGDFVFPENNMGEDMAIMIQLIIKVSKIAYVPNVFYHYFNNPTSITRVNDYKCIEMRFFQVKKNTDIALHALENYGFAKNNLNALCVMKLNVKRQLLPLVHCKKYYGIWRSTYPETNKQIWLSPYISFKEKLKYALTLVRMYPSKNGRVEVK